MGKSGPKSQNRQFKLKFGTKANLNMQNPKVLFTFAVLQRKYHFGQTLSQNSKLSV